MILESQVQAGKWRQKFLPHRASLWHLSSSRINTQYNFAAQ